MASVGQLLLTARELFPDPCGTISAPSLPSLTASTSGGTLATGTIYVKITGINAFGETRPSAEASVSVTGPTGSVAVSGTLPVGCSSGRAYYSGSSAGENQYIALDATGAGTIKSLTGGTAQPVPQINTAYLPDSDGTDVGAFTLYRWLNDGIQEAVRRLGGILDMGGVQAQLNQSEYPITVGTWMNISDAWFDGWLQWNAKRRDIWRHTNISAISNYISIEKFSDQFVIRYYPTPNRAGTTTTLTSGIGTTDTTIPVASIPSGLVSPGMIQIDNEIITFTTNDGSANLQGAVRGWAGTTPAAHSTSATVTELNITFQGYRLPNTFAVGNSALSTGVPATWETAVITYMLSRFRKFEQATQEAEELMQEFEAKLKGIEDSRPPKGPVEMGTSQHLLLYPGRIWGLILQ